MGRSGRRRAGLTAKKSTSRVKRRKPGALGRRLRSVWPNAKTRRRLWRLFQRSSRPIQGAICVATVLLDAGILPMQEPETRLMLEAPGGLIAVTAECRNGKAERISIENLPSFADRLDAPLEVAGLGALKVDIAYGGDSFVIVDAAALGFAIRADEARALAETGVRVIAAANDQLGFTHPAGTGWDQISFC